MRLATGAQSTVVKQRSYSWIMDLRGASRSPDVVRNGPKLDQRPPTTSYDGADARRWREGTAGRRERTPLLVAFVLVHRDYFHRNIDGARLPVDGGGLRLGRDGFERRRRGGVRADDHVNFKMFVFRFEQLFFMSIAS